MINLSKKRPMFLIPIFSIAVSAGWIIVAALLCSPVDGGRGGAIAVALSFLVIFWGKDTAVRRLDSKDNKEMVATVQFSGASKELNEKLRDIEWVGSNTNGALKALLDYSRKENLYLLVSSTIGTIAWGFGDILSKWLFNYLNNCLS